MNEHYANLELLMAGLTDINSVLDAGSGRTSLGYLISKFPNLKIDAIVFPGDERKKNSIKENVAGEYNLMEMDICQNKITKSYDLVMAHLLLGEATKFGNKVKDLLEQILDIDSKYFIILDIKEDKAIDYKELVDMINNKNKTIIKQQTFPKREPQEFRNFVGLNYVGYVIKNK